MKTKISLVRCPDYEPRSVEEAVRIAVDLLGGMAKFVRPGEKILLKPNLLSARVPERGVTTHPEVVRPVIRMVKEAGAVPLLGDSPGGAIKGVERVWNETGMKKLAQEENVELVNFETAGAREMKIDHPALPSLHVSRVPLEVDGIINLPKLKTHNFLLFTGGIKNFYGCIPGLRKAEYHKMAPLPDDFGRLIGELFLLMKDKVRLTLFDGIVGMEGDGPSSGELRALRMIAASPDTFALDAALTRMLGFKPEKISFLRYLSDRNAGENDPGSIEFEGERPENFALEDFRFPSNWYINLVPRFLVRLLGKLVWMKPFIISEVCENCSLCVNSCPVNAIRRPGGKGKPAVDMKSCISCLCCHELCPYHAVGLRASTLVRMLGKHK